MTYTPSPRSSQPGSTLHRSDSDRIFAGVCGGLGEHFGVNAWWFRWAFIFLALFAGIGVLIYVLTWITIPGPDEDEPIIARWVEGVDWSDGGTVFGIVLVGVAVILFATQVIHISGLLVLAAVLFLLGVLLYRGDLIVPRGSGSTPQPPSSSSTVKTEAVAVYDASGDVEEVAVETVEIDRDESSAPMPDSAVPPPQTPPRPPRERSMLGRLTIAVGLIVVATMALVGVSDFSVVIQPFYYFAAIIAVLGGGLLIGAWVGRARWLIIIGIIVTPMLWISMLFPVTWDFSAGDFQHTPATVQEVEAAYDQGMGQMTIDLTALSPSELTQVGTIQASLGLGEMIVQLPDDVGVVLLADIGAGEVTGPFRSVSGIGLDVTRELGPEPAVLVLDLEVGAGAIQISGPAGHVDEGFFIDDSGDITIIEGNN
jgi:phage shock protein PspC (stress-responsive transcriptional regulator)